MPRDKTLEPASLAGASAPVFVVGPGRSGTTLLMAMLDAHPEVVFPPEVHLLRRYVVPEGPRPPREIVETLADDEIFQRADVDPREVVPRGRDEGGKAQLISWSQVLDRFLMAVRKRSNASIVGAKDPKSVEHLPVLHALYPDARVLQMVRDPRDVYLSRQEAGWSAGRPWFAHTLAYRVHHNLGTSRGPELFGTRYRTVRYEDLITDPETELRGVCDTLGIEFRPEMLRFQDSADDLVAEDEADWKENVRGPLLSDNHGKWEGTLDRVDLLRIEAACPEVFGTHGYERAATGLSVPDRGRAAAIGALSRAAEMAYCSGVKLKNARALRRLKDEGGIGSRT